MKFLKKNKGIIISFLIGVILAGSLTVYATGYLASQVAYKDGKSVEEALNELYAKNINMQSTSLKISDFEPNVTADGNKINISTTSSNFIKGYLYFVDDVVKKISENSNETIEVSEIKKYKIYVVAIDEEGNLKKSKEVNITTRNSDTIFNGTSASTEITGGFNVSYIISNSYNTSNYTKVNGKDAFRVSVALSGNYGIAISKNKINVNELSSLKYIVSGESNHNDLNCHIFVGLASDNSQNTNYIRSNKIEGLKSFYDKELNVDVSDLSGEYYLKFITYHPTNVTNYNSFGFLNGIIANKKGLKE